MTGGDGLSGPTMAQDRMDKHISAIGILYIIYFVFSLLVAALVFSILYGTGILAGNRESMAILTTIGTIVSAYLLILALPCLIAGIGVLKHRNWGRVLSIVIGALSLLNFPFGTLLGVYTIWVMTQPETRRRFDSHGAF